MMRPLHLHPGRARSRGARLTVAAAVFIATAIGADAAQAQMSGKQSGVSVSTMQKKGGGFVPVGYFQYSGKPGSTMEGRLKISGRTSKVIDVALQPVAAQTAQNLGVMYAPVGSKGGGPLSWISVSEDEVAVSGKKAATVDVKVTIPQGTGPGDYLAGVSIFDKNQKALEQEVQGGATVKQLERVVIATQVAVPGARNPSIAFTGASGKSSPSGASFVLSAENNGNVLLENVAGTGTVTDPSGKQVAQMQIGPGGFVPGTSIDISVIARGLQPSAGEKFEVKAELDYEGRAAKLDTFVTFGKAAASQQKQFPGRPSGGGGLPWWVWIIVAVACVLLIGLVAWLVRRRRRSSRVLDASAIMLRLESDFQDASAAGGPLSVVAAWIGDGANPGSAGGAMRDVLRGRGTVGDLGGGWLVAVLPDAGPAAASGAAEDLERRLRAVEGIDAVALRVGSATRDETMTSARDLVERATASVTSQ